MNAQNRLLIIDDEPDLRSLLRIFAETYGYAVSEGGAGDDTLELFDEVDPTVIFLDLSMPERDGMEMLSELAQRNCASPIVLVSGASDRLLAAAKRVGRELGLKVPYVLSKPVNERYLRGVLAKAWQSDWTPSAREVDAAIEQGQMLVLYRPRLNLRPKSGGPVAGCEAVVHWRHPVRGLKPLPSFQSVVEEAGLMSRLTDMMVDQVFSEMQNWNQDGFKLPVAFGLSQEHLADVDLPGLLMARVEDAGIAPDQLVLQVNDAVIRPNAGVAVDTLARLLLKGFGICLDDFGADGSSVSDIYRLPVSEILIDLNLTRAAEVDMDARKVFQALVDLGHGFGLKVGARGLETERGISWLKGTGCDLAQGPVFSAPLPPEALRKFATRN